MCVTAINHGEYSAEWVVADLVVILVDEGRFTEAKAGQIISRCGPVGFTEFRRIDEHEPNTKTAFDIESVPVKDSRHVPLDAQSDGILGMPMALGAAKGAEAVRWWWRTGNSEGRSGRVRLRSRRQRLQSR